MRHEKLSFSTSWNALSYDNAESIVEEIRSLGFDRIELNFTLTKAIVDGIRFLVKDGKISVTSVHNFCPIPDELLYNGLASPDHYSMASLYEDIRLKAVNIAKTTIDTAESLGAKAVILHLGRVEIKDRTRDLMHVFGDEKKYLKTRSLMKKERNDKAPKHLEKALKSLNELSLYAKMRSVKLGIENRYYFREIPSLEELDMIMKQFEGDETVCYWHDIGHAEVLQALGLAEDSVGYLGHLKNKLFGMHIHDVEVFDDHRAPGKGRVDFSQIFKYINEDTILVFEIHPKSGKDDIIKGKDYIEKLLDKA